MKKNGTIQPKWNHKRQFDARARVLIIGEHTKTNAGGMPYVSGTIRSFAKNAQPLVSSGTMHKWLRREGLKGYKQVKVLPFANSNSKRETRAQRIQPMLDWFKNKEKLLELTIFSDEKQFVADTDSQGRFRIWAQNPSSIPYDERIQVNDKLKVHVSSLQS